MHHAVPYPTIHHFVTEMCTFLLQNGALRDIYVMHCGICSMDLLKCGLKLLVHTQTATVQPLKFWNGKVISSHNLLDM